MAVPWTHGLSLGQKNIIHMWSMTLLWQSKAIPVPDNAIFNLFLTVLIFCLFSSKWKLEDVRRKILQSSVTKVTMKQAQSQESASDSMNRLRPSKP